MSDTHDQQVEKGAKALYESAEALIEHTYTWEELDPPIKEPWLAKARAVLDAVRPQEDGLREAALDVLLYIATIDPACLQSDLEIEWYDRAKGVVQTSRNEFADPKGEAVSDTHDQQERPDRLECPYCRGRGHMLIVRGDLWAFDVKCAIKSGMTRDGAEQAADKLAAIRMPKLTAERAAVEYESAVARELGLPADPEAQP